jgi:Ca2+/Na+ antiporter
MLEDTLSYATLVLLVVTASIMLVAVFPRRNRDWRDDFVVLILLFVVGWFSTDLVSALVVQPVQSLVSLAYTLVLAGFLALVFRRLRWAAKEAGARKEEFSGKDNARD